MKFHFDFYYSQISLIHFLNSYHKLIHFEFVSNVSLDSMQRLRLRFYGRMVGRFFSPLFFHSWLRCRRRHVAEGPSCTRTDPWSAERECPRVPCDGRWTSRRFRRAVDSCSEPVFPRGSSWCEAFDRNSNALVAGRNVSLPTSRTLLVFVWTRMCGSEGLAGWGARARSAPCRTRKETGPRPPRTRSPPSLLLPDHTNRRKQTNSKARTGSRWPRGRRSWKWRRAARSTGRTCAAPWSRARRPGASREPGAQLAQGAARRTDGNRAASASEACVETRAERR